MAVTTFSLPFTLTLAINSSPIEVPPSPFRTGQEGTEEAKGGTTGEEKKGTEGGIGRREKREVGGFPTSQKAV